MKVSEGFAGVGTSTARVVEMYYPEDQRLINDQMAYKLLPFGWRVLVRILYLPGLRSVILSLRERRMPGTLGAFLCRRRYIDDELKRSLQGETTSGDSLREGLTPSYRIAGIDQVQVFEVDLPGTRKLKQNRLEKVLGAVPENVTLIGMDFDSQKLDEELKLRDLKKASKRFLFGRVSLNISQQKQSMKRLNL